MKANHPGCVFDEFKFDNLDTLEAFEADPTAKLAGLCKIVVHHLKEDGQSPLIWDGATSSLIVDDSVTMPVPPAPAGPDKIVIYTALPSSNEVIIKVCYSLR